MLHVSPPEYPHTLIQQAKSKPPAVTAVVNAVSDIAIEGAYQSLQEGIITPVLIGDIATIKRLANTIGWDLQDIKVYAAQTEEEAAKQAVKLALEGQVNMLMKGHVHTDTLLRAVLDKVDGLRTGARLSHVFHMTFPQSERCICITDAVINVAPDIKTQQHILHNCLALMQSLGYGAQGQSKANIALLSATEVPTAAMPSSLQAQALLASLDETTLAQANIFGPVALDGAISPEAVSIKGIDMPGAGHAHVLMVPNIETGNALFKQMVYFNGATGAGLVLGAKVPIVLTSRADPAVARLASCALGVIHAAHAHTS